MSIAMLFFLRSHSVTKHSFVNDPFERPPFRIFDIQGEHTG